MHFALFSHHFSSPFFQFLDGLIRPFLTGLQTIGVIGTLKSASTSTFGLRSTSELLDPCGQIMELERCPEYPASAGIVAFFVDDCLDDLEICHNSTKDRPRVSVIDRLFFCPRLVQAKTRNAFQRVASSPGRRPNSSPSP